MDDEQKKKILEFMREEYTEEDVFQGAAEADQVDEDGLRVARAKVGETISKLKDKKNPLTFFNDVTAQKAVGALPATEQSAFWAEAKAACPRLNLVDARRAVKEACGQVKRKGGASVSPGGFTQRNGSYWVEKMTKDGPLNTPISNFVLEPRLKLLMPGHREEVLTVDTYVAGSDKPFQRMLRTGDLLGRRELLRAIGSVSAQWTGNDTDVQQLVGHMAIQDPPTKFGVPFIGMFEGRFITPDVVLSADGPEEGGDYVHVPQKVGYENYVKFPRCDDWPALAKSILRWLPLTQAPNVILPLMGWFLACPVAPVLRKKWNEFPILHCWGTGGGGKTSLIQIFTRLLGVLSEPFSCSMKPFALIKMLACTNALPVFLDEYRPNSVDPRVLAGFHEKLLLVYKCSVESRGRPDQTTVEYQLMAPVVIAGEAPMPEAETGLMERVLQIKFDRNFLKENPEAGKAFNELVELPLEEFASGYITWLLRRDVMTSLDDAVKRVNGVLGSMVVPHRIKHNLAVMVTGLSMLGELAKELGVSLPRADFVSTLRQLAGEAVGETFEPKNALDRFMLHVEGMAHSGDLRQNVDYLLDEGTLKGTSTLYLYTNAAITTRAKWCKVRGLEHEVVNDRSLKIMMQENPGGYVLAASSYRKRIGSSNLRCSVIDAAMLERRLGISLDTWRDPSQRHMATPTEI